MTEEHLNEILSGKTPEEFRKDLEKQGKNINMYGEIYDINKELRNKFPNSYFYSDIYDGSITGVNLFTGSIIYELKLLGGLHTYHVESHYGDYGAVLECGGIVSRRMIKLTTDQLGGKIPPTVILLDDDMKEWEFVRSYLPGDMP